jgi:hypothetical protein
MKSAAVIAQFALGSKVMRNALRAVQPREGEAA